MSYKKYTNNWKRMRDAKLRANPICEICGDVATEVHHIMPIIDGGLPKDWNNLMSVCSSCHRRIHGK